MTINKKLVECMEDVSKVLKENENPLFTKEIHYLLKNKYNEDEVKAAVWALTSESRFITFGRDYKIHYKKIETEKSPFIF